MKIKKYKIQWEETVILKKETTVRDINAEEAIFTAKSTHVAETVVSTKVIGDGKWTAVEVEEVSI